MTEFRWEQETGLNPEHETSLLTANNSTLQSQSLMGGSDRVALLQ